MKKIVKLDFEKFMVKDFVVGDKTKFENKTLIVLDKKCEAFLKRLNILETKYFRKTTIELIGELDGSVNVILIGVDKCCPLYLLIEMFLRSEQSFKKNIFLTIEINNKFFELYRENNNLRLDIE